MREYVDINGAVFHSHEVNGCDEKSKQLKNLEYWNDSLLQHFPAQIVDIGIHWV